MRGEKVEISKIYCITGLSERLDCIEGKMNQMKERIEIMASQLEEALDKILAKVTEQDTRLDSVRELIVGLRKQIADALAQIGKLTPEELAKVDAVMAQAEKNSAEIEEAIAENTQP